jgi:hypothetical protein
VVADFFRTRSVHIVVDSTAFKDGVHTHVFDSTLDWWNEVYWARIFAGFHYHHSLEDGAFLGRQVAAQVSSKHFRRRHAGDDEDDR